MLYCTTLYHTVFIHTIMHYISIIILQLHHSTQYIMYCSVSKPSSF